jgi:protein PhnA
MTSESALLQRSGNQCECCKSTDNLNSYTLPDSQGQSDPEVLLCAVCKAQVDEEQAMDANHWRGLSDAMWSTESAVQVLSWRMLKRLESENWAQDLLEMLYLDEALQAWAEQGIAEVDDREPAYDSNGAELKAGDSVTIIKDLPVKGTSFVAKRGTAVRNISLTNNPEHIEGRVNGTRIVILTQYVKKN